MKNRKLVDARGYTTLFIKGVFINVTKDEFLVFRKQDVLEIRVTKIDGRYCVVADWFTKEFISIDDVVALLNILGFDYIEKISK